MSIEAVSRVAGRISEITSRFGMPPVGESDFRSLLTEASAGIEGASGGSEAVPTTLVAGPVTIGQMLGVAAPTQTRIGFPVAGVAPGEVTNSFGWHWGGHKHAGVDIFAPRGTDVRAPIGGEVELAGTGAIGGNYVWLRGDDGRGYYMAHLDAFADGIGPGQRVEIGETLGFVGTTGDAEGTPPHLHFAISRDADLKPGDSDDPAAAGWLDPGPFLGIEPSSAHDH